MKDISGHILERLHNIKRIVIKWFYTPLCYLECTIRGIQIGKGCKFSGFPVFHRNPESRIQIGNNCRFASKHNSNYRGLNHPCILQTGAKIAEIIIGDNCGFSGTTIVCNNKVTIENNVICGANTSIGDRDGHSNKYASKPLPIVIKEGVWLGMNVVVLKGVTIGTNAIIGANSLVCKDIPDNAIAAGNPCKVIKYRNL